MTLRRRTMLKAAAGAAVALSPLAYLFQRRSEAADGGPLVPDPARLLDLPAHFRYTVLERACERMSDGNAVPTRPDGMACFKGPSDTLVLMRNHELSSSLSDAGYDVSPPEAYDPLAAGGVTRLVLDAKTLRRISSNRVLAGTLYNCAGGASPWGWLSCEESTQSGHGYVFRCATDATRVRPPDRLPGYGRFRHEAACVDPRSLTAFLTEDQTDGAFYRYQPRDLSRPHTSGKLQALRVTGSPRFDTSQKLEHGKVLAVDWVDVLDPDPKDDTVRYQAMAAGAARFCRGEGVFYDSGVVYVCCTSGGQQGLGQVFKLTLGASGAPDRLELFAESPGSGVLNMPDNICVTPWGDVLVAEDGSGEHFVRGITPEGRVYDVARNAQSSGEFAGICVSPDGDALFVNLQLDGLTLAITGPLKELSRRGRRLARRASVA
ncbi:MAG TPA: alkaline phosphatase PhoX [Polyangiaceae bacterium]|nr:alkaline phosphatase PhoX [Polyangiaceae bacterium]